MADLPSILQEEFQKPLDQQFGGQISDTVAPPEPVFTPQQGIFANALDIAQRTSTASLLQWQKDNIYNSEDPGFDLKIYLDKNPDQRPYAHIFIDSNNEFNASTRWERFQRNQQIDQRISDSEAFWSKMATDMLLDPINVVPGAGIRRGVGIIEGVVRGAGAAIPSVVADAAIRMKYDPNASWDDVKEQMLYGTALTGILGGAVGMLRPGRTVGLLAQDMIDEGRRLAGDRPPGYTPKNPADESPVVLHSVPHDATGSYRPYEAVATEGMPTGFSKAYGLEKIAAEQSAFARIVNSGYRALEDLGNRLAGDYGVRFKRADIFESPEPSASLAVGKWQAMAGDAASKIRNFHAEYLTGGKESIEVAGLNVRSTLAGVADTARGLVGRERPDKKLTFQQFKQEVFKAHRADQIIHSIPEVEAAAKAIRPFFDDMLSAQLKSGYIRNPEWASGYQTRLFNELTKVRKEATDLRNLQTRTANQQAKLALLEEHIKLVDAERMDILNYLKMWSEKPKFSPTGEPINVGVSIEGVPGVSIKNNTGMSKPSISVVDQDVSNGIAKTSSYFFTNGRVITLVDIDGTKIPFYISTGQGGKQQVPTGKWYPFFGFGPGDAWFNKGSVQDILDFYGSPKLKAAAEMLDQSIGDVRNQKDTMPIGLNRNANISDWQKQNGVVDVTDMFSHMNPINYKGEEAIFRKNINDMVQRIESGSSKNDNIGSGSKAANANYEPYKGPEKFYLPRIFLPDQVAAKSATVRKTMTDWYMNPENNPDGVIPKLSEVLDRVDSEMKGMMKLGILPGSTGSRPSFTRSRAVEIPNEVFADLGVIDMDISNVMQFYARRAGMGLEYSRAFGDPNAQISISQAMLRVAEESKGKTANAILKEIEGLKGEAENLRDIQLGTIFAENADSIGRRSSSLIRSWFTLTSMGGALMNSMMEIVRPAMVLGIRENFDFALKALGNAEVLKLMDAEQRIKLSGYHELAAGQTFRKFFDNGLEAGVAISRSSKMLEKIEGPLSYLARTPEYVLNGVGILTHYQKQWTGFVAADMFANRIMRVADGTASGADAKFLVDYGISLEDARKMATMPIEKDKGIMFANTAAWADQDLADKFYQAIQAVQDRVITTPTAADKPSIMMGVLGKGTDRREAAMIGIPFQLKAWGFAANNKILMSGLQGRDANFMSGALMMIGAGYLITSMKTPEKMWNNMTPSERILGGLEASGVLGLYGDLNFNIEQMSQDKMGVRPLLGMQPKRGPADAYDMYGEVLGPGPSKMLDIYKTFSSPYATSRDRANSTIRALPFNNLIFIPQTFRTLARDAIEPLM
jgi:hypothetical protein